MWQSTINPFVPKEVIPKLLWLPDNSRNMGLHLMAGKGSGKSRIMGRGIAWQDFLRGVPTIIFDPMGGIIDNWLDKLIHLPQPLQERLWHRVLYMDASGKNGHVIPMPLYYHLGNEGLYEISQRYLDVVRRLDPALTTASIQGYNALWKLGTHIGMVLASLGCQITEATEVVLHPKDWVNRAQHTLAPSVTTEIAAALGALEAFAQLKDDIRQSRSETFLTKVSLFTLDPTMRAMFGASKPGINWQQVIDNRYTVLFDFRKETDIERRRFKMVWAFYWLLAYIKDRGKGRHQPISILIDELTSLFSPSVLASDLFAAELDELINVIARNCMLWLTLAHQEMYQLSHSAQKTLLAMGTQIVGVTNDREAALTLAHHFFPYDPKRTKSTTQFSSTPFTIDEQAYLNSNIFMNQERFHFLARVAIAEGNTQGVLQPITVSNFDTNIYPDEQLVAQVRERLMQARGRRVSEVLSEIESRAVNTKRSSPTTPAKGQSATLKRDGALNDSLSQLFRDKKTPTGTQAH